MKLQINPDPQLVQEVNDFHNKFSQSFASFEIRDGDIVNVSDPTIVCDPVSICGVFGAYEKGGSEIDDLAQREWLEKQLDKTSSLIYTEELPEEGEDNKIYITKKDGNYVMMVHTNGGWEQIGDPVETYDDEYVSEWDDLSTPTGYGPIWVCDRL